MPKGLRIDETLASRRSFHFSFEGREIPAYEGESVATALLAAGITKLRCSPGDGGPRGLFCAMGVCQECVVSVAGQAVEACRLLAAPGLDVKVQP
ncbi:(2Fe-2S)-binding protein [Bosea caraganae]|uniref:(2Fe-2S)-binding protein n=1 Tax=Bosea caraganae TaxID=2763117 RepID=A0A370KYL9_9HYPH|nr:(2Fe-2S)-binding protein [Bosea caraganae]RDJ20099.1 (2Fe-2S)-binding protein [Bosea caraganae]RDJ24811.1 (2Fe-2S)-binding protein [Bosea caraganae]